MPARGYEQDQAILALKERIRRLELAVARNKPAAGIDFNDDGGFFGGGTITLADILNALGLGTSPDTFLRTTLGGLDIVQALGTLGATETVDLANASVFWGTMDQDVTLTFVGWTNLRNATVVVELIEDGTGGWLPTFTGVTWVGSAPIAAAAGEVIQVVLRSRDGGTTIWGVVVGGGGGSAIEVLDEGVSLTAALTSMDFVGAGVTATTSGDDVTVTIPGFTLAAADIAALGFVGPILMADGITSPPEPLWNDDGTDYLYQDMG